MISGVSRQVPQTLARILDDAAAASGLVTVLTGAGISAESGIPTFRGSEGYWTVGSKVFFPQEMATNASFRRMPEEVWRWYLYRLGVCWGAEPNAAHRALVRLEEHLGDRFLLITQNVDGLHLRAGSRGERTYQIHGHIDSMRCAGRCPGVVQVPEPVRDRWARRPGEADMPSLTAEEVALLTCGRCSGWMRPHVLWFDEYYDEEHFRFESSLAAADRTALLIIVGTSGATNLPNQVAGRAARRGASVVLVDPEGAGFADLASGRKGFWANGTAGEWVPAIVDRLVGERP